VKFNQPSIDLNEGCFPSYEKDIGGPFRDFQHGADKGVHISFVHGRFKARSVPIGIQFAARKRMLLNQENGPYDQDTRIWDNSKMSSKIWLLALTFSLFHRQTHI